MSQKLYGQKNEGGELVVSVFSKRELSEPWIELDQDYVCGGMVWDEDQGKFITPPQ